MKYNAFISYSHSQDSRLAPSLETALEKFAKPTFKRRALHIFRDSNDLSVSPDLWGKIEQGLSETGHFIYFASPKAAASHYCNKEVAYWMANKSMDNFLVALTDGEILWDHEKNDFNWEKTTAIPKILAGAFKNEPLYVDFREVLKSEDLSLDNAEFKTNAVLFAATLHGKSIGDMVGEDVKQHKRTMRIRNAAIGVLSTLLVAAILLSVYAVNQKNTAVAESRKALLSNYISSSQAQFNEDATKSLRLAEHAYQFAKTNDLPRQLAAEQLIKVFYSGSGFYQELGTVNSPFNVVVSQNRPYIGNRIVPVGEYYSTDEVRFIQVPDYDFLCAKVFNEINSSNQIVHTYRFENFVCDLRYTYDGTFLTAREMDGWAYFYESGLDREFAQVKAGWGGSFSEYRHNILLLKPGNSDPLKLVPGNGNSVPIVRTNGLFILDVNGNTGQASFAAFHTLNDEQPGVNTIVEGIYGIKSATISPNGRFSLLGNNLIDNLAYKDGQNRDPYKNKLTFNHSGLDGKIGFSEDSQYVIIETAENLYYKIAPYPYLEFNTDLPPAYHEGDASGFTFESENKVTERYLSSSTVRPYVLYEKNNRAVAYFTDARTRLETIPIGNGDHYSIDDYGLYNANDELLIRLDLITETQDQQDSYELSENKKFLLVKYQFDRKKQRVFPLDPEFIIARINDKEIMGSIAYLSVEDKKRFLVEGNEVSISSYSYPEYEVDKTGADNEEKVGVEKAEENESLNDFESSSKEAVDPVEEVVEDTSEEEATQPERVVLTVATITVDNLRVRSTPNLNGTTITNLAIGSSIYLTGEKSEDKITVEIVGQDITDHWYKIQTDTDIVGWIHGCCFQ